MEQQSSQRWMLSGPTPQKVPASPLTHAPQQIVSPASQVIGTDFFSALSSRKTWSLPGQTVVAAVELDRHRAGRAVLHVEGHVVGMGGGGEKEG